MKKPKCSAPKCSCHLYERRVCDICQGVCTRCDGRGTINLVVSAGSHRTVPCDACDGKNPVDVNPKYGYHSVKIKKGVLGETSKIQEELDELIDAEKQGVKILIAVELSDLYGALRAIAVKHGYKMADLHDMAKLTRRAFEQGHRK